MDKDNEGVNVETDQEFIGTEEFAALARRPKRTIEVGATPLARRAAQAPGE